MLTAAGTPSWPHWLTPRNRFSFPSLLLVPAPFPTCKASHPHANFDPTSAFGADHNWPQSELAASCYTRTLQMDFSLRKISQRTRREAACAGWTLPGLGQLGPRLKQLSGQRAPSRWEWRPWLDSIRRVLLQAHLVCLQAGGDSACKLRLRAPWGKPSPGLKAACRTVCQTGVHLVFTARARYEEEAKR